MLVRTRRISVQALLIALVTSLLVPTLLFSYVLLGQVAEGERNRTRGDALDLARQIAVDVDRELSGLLGALQVLTTYISFDLQDWAKVYSQATEVKEALGAEVIFKTPDGQQQVNTRFAFGAPLPQSLPAADQRALRELKPTVSDLFTGATAQRHIVSLNAPIIREGAVTGLVNIAIDPERLSKVLATGLLPQGWMSALVDNNGRIVARSRNAADFVGSEATPDLLANTGGREGFWVGSTKEGEPVLSAYARSSLSGWRVAVGAPKATVYQPLRTSLQWLSLLGLACLGLGLSAAFICGRQISRSLKQVAQRAASLTQLTAVEPFKTRISEVAEVSDALVAASKDLHEQDMQRREAEGQLIDETNRLETLNRVSISLGSELDPDVLMQKITDSAVTLSGASFGAFFYNVQEDGQPMMLYTVSGVSRDAFSRFPMPRATSIFAPTLMRAETIRSADITADSRYGKNAPHSGMPVGHLPVRSYLAIPVVSRTGEILGGLFLGHPEPDVFTVRHENLVAGVAGQAAISLDNAQLLKDARAAENEVREFNRRLEVQVAERTQSLTQANAQLLDEIAHRQKAEDQLRQSQKMEAVGQLTGGIAHDFNNLLAVIVGSLQLIRKRLDRGEATAAYKFLDNATEGANRAASLTQRLLAFSRQQALAPEPIEVNKLIQSTSELLRRTLGEHVRVETVLAGGLWSTHADRPQLESAIINLAVNARDAMSDGGKLTIETANTHLDEKYASEHPGIAAGQYVMIALTDTGAGMPSNVIAKAFEPFFTTKGVGKGTGLGLSQVYGFVRQSRGHVKIYSEPGQGTSVKIYLPRYRGEQAGHLVQPPSEVLSSGETDTVVLVVEDDEAVRETSVAAVRELGYAVIEADGASSALQILDSGVKVSLLFTDVVMPEINGRKLADEALSRRPGLKVLFTTGYTQNAIVHNGLLDAEVHLVSKPFTMEQLSVKIRAALVG